MKKCYPNSQIFSETHSYRKTKCLKRRSDVFDLRLMHANRTISDEPWRLMVIDEIDDALYKLNGLRGNKDSNLYNTGIKLRDISCAKINDLEKFRLDVSNFLKEVSDLYVIGMLSCDI